MKSKFDDALNRVTAIGDVIELASLILAKPVCFTDELIFFLCQQKLLQRVPSHMFEGVLHMCFH